MSFSYLLILVTIFLEDAVLSMSDIKPVNSHHERVGAAAIVFRLDCSSKFTQNVIVMNYEVVSP